MKKLFETVQPVVSSTSLTSALKSLKPFHDDPTAENLPPSPQGQERSSELFSKLDVPVEVNDDSSSTMNALQISQMRRKMKQSIPRPTDKAVASLVIAAKPFEKREDSELDEDRESSASFGYISSSDDENSKPSSKIAALDAAIPETSKTVEDSKPLRRNSLFGKKGLKAGALAVVTTSKKLPAASESVSSPPEVKEIVQPEKIILEKPVEVPVSVPAPSSQAAAPPSKSLFKSKALAALAKRDSKPSAATSLREEFTQSPSLSSSEERRKSIILEVRPSSADSKSIDLKSALMKRIGNGDEAPSLSTLTKDNSSRSSITNPIMQKTSTQSNKVLPSPQAQVTPKEPVPAPLSKSDSFNMAYSPNIKKSVSPMIFNAAAVFAGKKVSSPIHDDTNPLVIRSQQQFINITKALIAQAHAASAAAAEDSSDTLSPSRSLEKPVMVTREIQTDNLQNFSIDQHKNTYALLLAERHHILDAIEYKKQEESRIVARIASEKEKSIKDVENENAKGIMELEKQKKEFEEYKIRSIREIEKKEEDFQQTIQLFEAYKQNMKLLNEKKEKKLNSFHDFLRLETKQLESDKMALLKQRYHVDLLLRQLAYLTQEVFQREHDRSETASVSKSSQIKTPMKESREKKKSPPVSPVSDKPKVVIRSDYDSVTNKKLFTIHPATNSSPDVESKSGQLNSTDEKVKKNFPSLKMHSTYFDEIDSDDDDIHGSHQNDLKGIAFKHESKGIGAVGSTVPAISLPMGRPPTSPSKPSSLPTPPSLLTIASSSDFRDEAANVHLSGEDESVRRPSVRQSDSQSITPPPPPAPRPVAAVISSSPPPPPPPPPRIASE